ncbi:hypothetical protein [Castellaniella defragrans]|nr:hypothetical protein [Castellaniella defragrans]
MTKTYSSAMTPTSDSWLTLIVSLPSASATACMRIWRAIKTLGCAALRDRATDYAQWLSDLAGARKTLVLCFINLFIYSIV